MKLTVDVNAQIKSCSDQQVVVEVAIPLVGSMLSGEEVGSDVAIVSVREARTPGKTAFLVLFVV